MIINGNWEYKLNLQPVYINKYNWIQHMKTYFCVFSTTWQRSKWLIIMASNHMGLIYMVLGSNPVGN